jgi:predicted lipoprotein with Yx(FWY)xxD motif
MKTSTIILAAVIIVIVLALGIYYVAKGSSYAKSPITYTTVPASTVAYTTIAPSAGNSTASSTVAASSTITSNATTTVNATNASYTVNIAHSSSVGYYLANASGYTLYYYKKDTPNSANSTCYGPCATNWPPFYATSFVLPASLNASNFGTITRTGGAMQTTYKGWPLYRFLGDGSSGQVSGQGISDFYVVNVSATGTT